MHAVILGCGLEWQLKSNLTQYLSHLWSDTFERTVSYLMCPCHCTCYASSKMNQLKAYPPSPTICSSA